MGAMDYELAKELEDAGFPPGGKGGFVASPDKVVVRREDRVYCPTLSELIAACGDQFHSLIRTDNGWDAAANFFPRRVHGTTPEEAIARLWLALNRSVGL